MINMQPKPINFKEETIKEKMQENLTCTNYLHSSLKYKLNHII